MPIINFNTPFVNEKGETVMRVKVDEKKTKLDENGNGFPKIVTDEEGHAVQEVCTVADMLTKILHKPYAGDEAMSFKDRAFRGKLARKVATSDEKHYSDKELMIIEELSSKAGATMLLAQLDDLIHGGNEAKSEAA